jgi:hypothetical protein
MLQGNDIILCDGPCNRGYHEQCLDPPLTAASLADAESWLCPACEAKVRHMRKGICIRYLSTLCSAGKNIWRPF